MKVKTQQIRKVKMTRNQRKVKAKKNQRKVNPLKKRNQSIQKQRATLLVREMTKEKRKNQKVKVNQRKKRKKKNKSNFIYISYVFDNIYIKSNLN